jgi:hypothetical protein
MVILFFSFSLYISLVVLFCVRYLLVFFVVVVVMGCCAVVIDKTTNCNYLRKLKTSKTFKLEIYFRT